MVGSYAETKNALELRKPARVFVPLAWLFAGPANPGGFLAFPIWGQEFDFLTWVIGLAIPLSIGCAGALYFLRDGGFGIMTLALIVIVVTASACGVVGPAYTYLLSGLRDLGIDLDILPVSNMEDALRTSGTFVRLALFMSAIAIIPAILVLRLIAFQREPKKPPR